MSVQFDASRNRRVVRWSEPGAGGHGASPTSEPDRSFDAERREARIAAREADAAGLAGE